MATAAAIHEAGHCVAAVIRGLPVSYATTKATDPHTKLARLGLDGIDSTDMLTVWAAGSVAERRATGKASVLDAADREQAAAMAAFVCAGDASRVEACLSNHEVLADAIVVQHLDWIGKVADELDRRVEIEGFRILALRPPSASPEAASDTPPRVTSSAATIPRALDEDAPADSKLLVVAKAFRRACLDMGTDGGAALRGWKALTAGIKATAVAEFVQLLTMSALGHLAADMRALKAEVRALRDDNAALKEAVEDARRGAMKYAGPWLERKGYDVGAVVSYRGSAWVATASTYDKPGDGATAWRLFVKCGRDGRDAKEAAA